MVLVAPPSLHPFWPEEVKVPHGWYPRCTASFYMAFPAPHTFVNISFIALPSMTQTECAVCFLQDPADTQGMISLVIKTKITQRIILEVTTKPSIVTTRTR